MAITDTDPNEVLLIVRVGQIHLALSALTTEGIAPLPSQITLLPGRDSAISGVFEHGGHRVALVDLRLKLGLPVEGRPGRVVLGQVGNQRLGFAVDEVLGILRRSDTTVMPLPAELPRHHFSEALLAHGHLALRTGLAQLLTLDTVVALKRMVPPEEPPPDVAPPRAEGAGGHVPLDQALSHAAKEARRAPRETPAVRDRDTRPTPSPARIPPPMPVTPKAAPSGRSITAPTRDSSLKPHPPARKTAENRTSERLVPERDSSRPAPFRPTSPAAITEPAGGEKQAWPLPLLLLVLFIVVLGLGWGLLEEWDPSAPASRIPSRMTPAPVNPTASAVIHAETAVEEKTAIPAQIQLETTSRGVELIMQTPAPENREFVHTVVEGDTLWAIAKRYIQDPLAYRELAKRSGIDDPDLIHPGERVYIVIRGQRTEDR